MLLSIEKLIYGGDGLARGPDKTIFVPFVLEGEQVDAEVTRQRPGFARAQATRIVSASEYRIEARCPYFQHCGGCHYQHTSYEHQLEIKASILRETLRRTGEVLLATGDAGAAEASYHEAIAIAQRQCAKLWELRAATSLARLWRGQGKRSGGRDLLAPVYGWFTEGLGTPVLQEAKALLDELT